jgi:hypothetical protein
MYVSNEFYSEILEHYPNGEIDFTFEKFKDDIIDVRNAYIVDVFVTVDGVECQTLSRVYANADDALAHYNLLKNRSDAISRSSIRRAYIPMDVLKIMWANGNTQDITCVDTNVCWVDRMTPNAKVG